MIVERELTDEEKVLRARAAEFTKNDLPFMSADEIRAAALETGNVISFATAYRLNRSYSDYKAWIDRVDAKLKGKRKRMIEATPDPIVA